MDELIQKGISEIPWLLWLSLVLLFLWGLLLILKQLYSLFHQVRKNYITELKEHLNFREVIIKDIFAQKVQLESQNCELKMEAHRKEEIIDATIKTAIVYMTEKDKELEKLKSDTSIMIQQLKYALGTALWVTEREIFLRKIFLYVLTKSTVPDDINEFLGKNIGSIIPLIKSDDDICNQEKDPVASDFLEGRAAMLSTYYLQLPIQDEMSSFKNIGDGMLALPSFIKKDSSDQAQK